MRSAEREYNTGFSIVLNYITIHAMLGQWCVSQWQSNVFKNFVNLIIPAK